MKINPTDPAFPTQQFRGLTIRAHMASLAMEAVLKDVNASSLVECQLGPTIKSVSAISVRMADALIAELNK